MALPDPQPNASLSGWQLPAWLPCVGVWLIATAALAQKAVPEAPTPLSTGIATLVLEGRPAGTVATATVVDGPRFALVPIAVALGVELRVGPLGESHTLIFEDRQIIVGPHQPTLLTVTPDGKNRRDVVRLSRMPIRDAQGLKLSLDALEKALGEPLNYQFTWDGDLRALEISRPELRFLRGAVNLRHSFPSSWVEIDLSESPRYRVERLPGGLEVRLIGDRLETPVPTRREADPFVEDIVVEPDRVRLELADGAVAAEPRLLLRPTVRLVIEVFEGGEAPRAAATDPLRRRRRRSPGVRTIVLDPGHGGSETGAVGAGGTAEAGLTLMIARALRLQLERRLPVRVVMTRTEDVDVPLETRTAIANQNRADLFISLHLNSSFGSRPHGAETYFLSREASDQLAAAVAEAENQSASQASPELDLQMILWDLAQSYHLAESQRFANLVQEELNIALGLRDRGVKQAPFTVLMGAQMPAVLVELGFLSNPEEEEKLQSPAYRAELVDALLRAVSRFKRQVEDQDLAEREGGSSGDDPPAEAAGAKSTP